MAEKLKMQTTKAGAKQFGSIENARKHAKKAFNAFLKNPTDKNLTILEKLDAAQMAALSKETRKIRGNNRSNIYDFLEKSALSNARKAKARSLLNLKSEK